MVVFRIWVTLFIILFLASCSSLNKSSQTSSSQTAKARSEKTTDQGHLGKVQKNNPSPKSNTTHSTTSSQQVTVKNFQVIRPETELFKHANFDSEVIAYLNPGVTYKLATKKYGPFYRAVVAKGVIGFVSEADVDIEGQGPLKPREFMADVNPLDQTKEEMVDSFYEEEMEFEGSRASAQSYQGVLLSFMNYHEDTMGDEQISDMWTLGYKYVPYYSDFSTAISWDVNTSLGVPKHYKDKTGGSASGLALWGGAQVMGVNSWAKNRYIKYGLGAFAKYSKYNVKTSLRNYDLQGMAVGASFEAGLVFLVNRWAIDTTIRYYWEKDRYATLMLGVLF